MSTRLEHANLAVRDVDAMLSFLQTAFPDFHIRGESKTGQGGLGPRRLPVRVAPDA
jgi:hypothetical protein